MVRKGDKFEEQGIIFKVEEIFPHFDPSGVPMYMITFRLKDGKFVTNASRFWMRQSADIRPHVQKEIQGYLDNKKVVQGIPIEF